MRINTTILNIQDTENESPKKACVCLCYISNAIYLYRMMGRMVFECYQKLFHEIQDANKDPYIVSLFDHIFFSLRRWFNRYCYCRIHSVDKTQDKKENKKKSNGRTKIRWRRTIRKKTLLFNFDLFFASFVRFNSVCSLQ